MSRLRHLAVLSAVLGLAACNQPHVRNVQSYLGPPMPRPDHVLVSYFSVTPEQVQLDQGISARIMRRTDDTPLTSQQYMAAQATQAALAQHLVDRLRAYGLPAEVAPPYAVPGSKLLVQGQIVAIDQGNRTRRTLIGLGAGKSSVSADAQLYYAAGDDQPRFVSAFEGEATSGRMPGAVGTMGAGAVAQRVATSAVLTGATHAGSEMRRATGTAEADRLAEGLAKQVGQLAVTQGWIAASAVR